MAEAVTPYGMQVSMVFNDASRHAAASAKVDSMTSGKILLHPGFHKTGTTFLQEQVFSVAPLFTQPWARQCIYDHFFYPHELGFDAQSVRKSLEAIAGTGKDAAVTVLSEEGLSGNPFNGARESAAHARHLNAVFPEAKVVITVRRQAAMLRAIYLQYLKAGGRHSPQDFFNPKQEPEFTVFDVQTWHYHRLVEHYATLFGEENILVLPQEHLQHDQADFVDQLCAFVGVETGAAENITGGGRANVSPPASGIPLIRLANHFWASPFNEHGFINSSFLAKALVSLGYRNTRLLRSQKPKLNAAISAFDGQFAQSNLRLQEFCPVDLKGLGYEI